MLGLIPFFCGYMRHLSWEYDDVLRCSPLISLNTCETPLGVIIFPSIELHNFTEVMNFIFDR